MADFSLKDFDTGEKAKTLNTKAPSLSMLKHCDMMLRAAEKYQKADDRLEKWKRLSKKFRGDYGKENQETKVETIAATTFATLKRLSTRPSIRLTPKGAQYVTEQFGVVDNVRNSKYREVAINQLFEEIRVHRQVKRSVRDVLVPYDLGVLKMGWGLKTTTDAKGIENISEEGLWIKRWKPSDFLPGPTSTEEEDMPYCLWRFFISKKKAKKMEGWNQDVIGKMTQTVVPKALHSEDDRTFGDEMELLEMFELHHIEENWISIIGRNASDLVLKPYDNPYAFKGMHGALFIPYSMDDDIYGRSQGELIESQANLKNESRRKILTHTRAFPAIVKDNRPESEANDAKWKYTPYGGKLSNPGGKPGDLEIMTVPPASSDFYNVGNIAHEDMMFVLGQTDMNYGQAAKMKATQAAIVANNEDAGFAEISEGIAETYRTLAIKAGDMLVQFMSGEQIVGLSGELPKGINPFEGYSVKDIIGNFDHSVDIESMNSGNNQVKSQTIMNGLIQMLDPKLGEISQKVQREYDMVEMFKKAQKLNGLDLEEFKKPDEEGAKANDPFDENRQALAGKLLADPLPGEEWHLSAHVPVAMTTKDEELSRHIIKHRELQMNSPQGIQQAQMQPQGPQGGQQMPAPTMGGPQGGPPVQQAIPQGVAQQINPMMGGR